MENPIRAESNNSESIRFPEKLSSVGTYYNAIKESYTQMWEKLRTAYREIDFQTESQMRAGFYKIISGLREKGLLPDSVFLESESMKIVKRDGSETPNSPDKVYYLPKSNEICHLGATREDGVLPPLDELKSAGILPSDISFEPVGKDTAYGELSIENIDVIIKAIEDYLYEHGKESRDFYFLSKKVEDKQKLQRVRMGDVIRENYGCIVKVQIINIRDDLKAKFKDKAFAFDWAATGYDSEKKQSRYFLPDEGRLVWAPEKRTTKGLLRKKTVIVPDFRDSQDVGSKYWTQDGPNIMRVLIGPHLPCDLRGKFNLQQFRLMQEDRKLGSSMNRMPPIF